ncbi:RNA-binding transcriptional accessory protein [Candidatus Desantisbacteria bacterium]|nr:RNA-binding transcriptional accessory protein [Candidatus Desantisbacteria bacterium]
MNEKHILKVAEELKLSIKQILATDALLEEGGTIPFISRYRKEATGSLDEVAVTAIRDRLTQLKELDRRRLVILKSLEDTGNLTDELKEKVLAAETMAVLEDIYLPYRPKRRTRAMIAKEKGLEPLAQMLFAQNNIDPFIEAGAFVNLEKGVENIEDALNGARDIIAEWINEDQNARAQIRELFFKKGVFECNVIEGKEEEGIKYKDYFNWKEPVANAPSHRVLAMRRGENEEFLTLRIAPPEESAIALLESLFVKGSNAASEQVKLAVHDSYKRLLSTSMETEIRTATKEKADDEAIRVFVPNLRQLLLAPPLGQKNVLSIDPGFRTGCKVVCLNRQGKFLHTDVIYPGKSEREEKDAISIITFLCKKFEIEVIAIGNGTAGRETEAFIKKIELPKNIQIIMVNESGASIYSASDVARKEFPDQDITVRGAISIGRRLMDPLSELVKINPKSIGVGQYQHDVDQEKLKNSLDDVVTSCVNAVGVEVNTASQELLMYVSGLGPQLAKKIVDYRNENGPFKTRKEFKKVPKLGPKTFEQAAGFLRIRDGEMPLDSSAVHPESYGIVDDMASDLKCSVIDLLHDENLRRKIELKKYVTDKVGLPTLNDIMNELAKPGRDPREKFEIFSFTEGVEKIEDVKPGMKLPGIVTNITAFGVFVDIGVHQDGLIHVSRLSDRFIKDIKNFIKVNQKVIVTVLEVDIKRKRITLSMKSDVLKQNPGTEKKLNSKPNQPTKAEGWKDVLSNILQEMKIKK